MPVYKRLVEIGRVAFIAKGKDQDIAQVLIDGPSTGVARSKRNLKDLQLTKFKLGLRVAQRTKGVKKVFDAEKIGDKFAATKWAKNIADKQKRASLTDFERFKLMRAKQLRNRLVRIEYQKLRKSQSH